MGSWFCQRFSCVFTICPKGVKEGGWGEFEGVLLNASAQLMNKYSTCVCDTNLSRDEALERVGEQDGEGEDDATEIHQIIAPAVVLEQVPWNDENEAPPERVNSLINKYGGDVTEGKYLGTVPGMSSILLCQTEQPRPTRSPMKCGSPSPSAPARHLASIDRRGTCCDDT